MSATIALTADEVEAIARANAALMWIRADGFPWPVNSSEIKTYAAGLRDSLDDYAALAADRTHPASVFPDLDRHQDDAMAQALGRVTEDIRKWTRALVDLAQAAEDAASDQEEEMAA